MEDLTVKNLREQGLLQILQKFCPSDVIGDDGALLSVPPRQQVVVTTDVLIEGVHFSPQTTEAEDAGWRAVAANLSDLAAMGAFPLGITVGLGLPGDTSVAWLQRLYQGMADCLQTYDTVMLGGDICRSPVISISITALGSVFPDQTIRRFSAQVGDVILITGEHGLSRGGLELLLNSDKPHNLSKENQNKLIKAHQRPKPRLDVIKRLNTIKDLPSIAGMDSSDGLADAIIQICRCSGVGAQIELDLLPISPELKQWVGREKALEWTLYGGEDFELVLCLPLKFAQILLNQLGENAAIIGHLIEEKTVTLLDKTGNFSPRILTLEEGFQHFG